MFGDNAPDWMCLTSHRFKHAQANESFNKARIIPPEILEAKAKAREALLKMREAEREALAIVKQAAKIAVKAEQEKLSQRRKAERAERQRAKRDEGREEKRLARNEKLRQIMLKKLENVARKSSNNRPSKEKEHARALANRIPPEGYTPVLEAAKMIGRGRTYFTKPVAFGRIKAIKQGYRTFVDMESVRAYMVEAAANQARGRELGRTIAKRQRKGAKVEKRGR